MAADLWKTRSTEYLTKLREHYVLGQRAAHEAGLPEALPYGDMVVEIDQELESRALQLSV